MFKPFSWYFQLNKAKDFVFTFVKFFENTLFFNVNSESLFCLLDIIAALIVISSFFILVLAAKINLFKNLFFLIEVMRLSS